MICDVNEGETISTIRGKRVHCTWIRHEIRDNQGTRTTNLTLQATHGNQTIGITCENTPAAKNSALEYAAVALGI